MNETFGQRIMSLRKKKGITQEELANRLNISPQAVSKWENDINLPDILTLPLIAEIFDTTIDELLGKKVENKVECLTEEKRKDISKMFLKIRVLGDGNKVVVNIPILVIKACIEAGVAIPQVSGNTALSSIDFNEIYKMIEQGVIGEIASVETDDGEKVSIIVE